VPVKLVRRARAHDERSYSSRFHGSVEVIVTAACRSGKPVEPGESRESRATIGDGVKKSQRLHAEPRRDAAASRSYVTGPVAITAGEGSRAIYSVLLDPRVPETRSVMIRETRPRSTARRFRPAPGIVRRLEREAAEEAQLELEQPVRVGGSMI